MQSGQRTSGDTGSVPIAEVSELLGIPIPTIRSWERRYPFLDPARTEGGHRRYTEQDMRTLRAVRDEIARGRPAAAAVEAVERTQPGPEHLPFVHRFVAGVEARAPDGMIEALEDARDAVGLEDAIERVVLPGMRDVGWRWLAGRCDVGAEHLATDTVRGWLARWRTISKSGDRRRWLVLACGPDDFHTVGLEAFAALMTHRGWDSQFLGARTPVASLQRAAAAPDTAAVVLVSHLGVNRRTAVAALRATTEASSSALFYAGNAFIASRARRGTPGTYLGESIVEAADAVREAVA